MTLPPLMGGERPRGFEISVGQLIWLALAAVFVSFRFAALLSVPVGGVELDSLAGAWQAHAGNTDERFIPTLFQALTSWTFLFTTSEVPARVLALAATCSIPFAIYRLRPSLGETGAMAALLVLAIEPFSVLLGSTAWHGAFDLALAVWLVALLKEKDMPNWAYGVAGFLVATAGATVLPIVLGFAAVRLFQQSYPSRDTFFWAGGGVLLGGIIAVTSFGYGLQDPTLPPIAALARGFEAPWSSESTGALIGLYSLPLLIIGVVAAGFHVYQCWRDDEWPEESLGLFAAGGIALTWMLVASGANDPVPMAAAAVPLSLLIGKVTPWAISGLSRVPWLYAAPAIAGLLLMLLIAEAFTVDWARIGRAGDDREKLIVTGLLIASVAFVGLICSNRRAIPALIVPFAGVGGLLMLSGAANVAFGGPNEPLPSPASMVQGREIRDIALRARAEQGGLIVVHSDFEAESTWPMRNSGVIVFASRVPPDATAVVWPVTLPAPEGFAVIEGQWSFQEIRYGPDGDFLDYLRWLSNRNSLKNGFEPLAVYLRTSP